MLASRSEAEVNDILDGFTDHQLKELEYDWGFWGRTDQQIPPKPWSIWIALAGRGWGKTRVGGEYIRQRACGRTPLGKGKARHIAIVGETAADARDVMIEGVSGILAAHPKDFRPHYEPSKRKLTWPNGATALVFNATEPDQLRGPQFDTAWLDEMAKWRYIQETWDMLQFGMRLGDDPEQLITTTPKPLPLIREILKYPYTHVTRGSTYDNKANLAPSFFAQVVSKYEGTRLGRQEIEAEILDDVPNALFSRANIDRNRVRSLPELDRIVVGVDPSGTEGDEEKRSDEVGIVVAGRSPDKHGYVIDDRSINDRPEKWARAVLDAYDLYEADEIVVETNFGGAMVEAVIRSVPGGGSVPIKKVTASRGKHIRAQPVASLYEQDRIHHLGSFGALEDQLCLFTPDCYMGGRSPDRADAGIWALTDLLVQPIKRTASKEARM